ncbi:hypothetical protein [Pseudomonas vanderleydeniana]|uniref:Uncharacterized protein n=1 Tax=Pseudomonas vanderleydeniana TaxID=2745495 RepID=A0A9E6PGU9_9PSED|nr:hypothetical protein [Pseudomonas vanderleydeniana]QXI26316.1 hypothetical protein HU752_020475 [Pseudomonas vanderleydeniana]
MSLNTDISAHAIRIDFQQDTLLGVNTFSLDCTAQRLPSSDPPSSAVQLLIAPPWPVPLEDAHTVAFDWEGTRYSGTLQGARHEPDGRLLLTIALQT